MPIRPVLIARTPRRLPPTTLIHDPSSVGVLRVKGPAPPGVLRHADLEDTDDWLVVAIVTTLPFVATERGAVGHAGHTPFGPAPRVAPSDLVPWRATTDVVLRGTIDAGAVSLRVGAVERRFATAVPVGRADLSRGLLTAEGLPAGSSVPVPPDDQGGLRWLHPSQHEGHHAATPPLRFARLRGDEVIVLRAPGRELHLSLPGLAPRLRIVAAVLGVPDQDLWAGLEEIVVDVDGGGARLVHRALVPTSRTDARDVDRIDVLFADVTAEGAGVNVEGAERAPFLDHDVPRAVFEHAWELPQAVAGEAPPPLDAQTLEIARYETWDHAGPLPTIPLAAAAAIAAELAEQRDPRDVVVARHGLTRYEWELEERAWAEAMAVPPGPEGELSNAEVWSQAFQEAQARLARPEEASRTPEDYARIAVALEGTAPDAAFADHGIGLGAYQRLDRRMQARAAEDGAFAAHLEQLMEAARAAMRAKRGDGRFAGVDVDEDVS